MTRRLPKLVTQSRVRAPTYHFACVLAPGTRDGTGAPRCGSRSETGMGALMERPAWRRSERGWKCYLPAHPVFGGLFWGARLVHQYFPQPEATAMLIPPRQLPARWNDKVHCGRDRTALRTIVPSEGRQLDASTYGPAVHAAKRKGCMVRKSATLWMSEVKLGTSTTLTPLESKRRKASIRKPSPRPRVS